MMEKLIKKLNNRKGFTLIELIVVIAIIGILAAILIPQFSGFTDKAKSTQATVNAKQIATAADSLIAEGMTSYSASNNTATDKVMGDAEIQKVAGVPTTGLSNGTWSKDHFGFTYTLTDGAMTVVVTRTTSGAMTSAIQ